MLGNGDIWEAEDALRMMRTTGCDGVVVGRGCLGRPWLFRDLADVFDGREPPNPPAFGAVVDIMLRARARSLAVARRRARRCARSATTPAGTRRAFAGSARLRQRLMQVRTLGGARGDPAPPSTAASPSRPSAMRVPRGKTAGTQKVALPDGYLDTLDDATPPGAEAETADSGG